MNENKARERGSDHYNSLYSKSKVYTKSPEDIGPYFPLWSAAADIISEMEGGVVVDLGCGPGHFPRLLLDRAILGSKIRRYFGYDFSKVSLRMATNLVGNNQLCGFYEQDLLTYDFSNSKPKDSIYVSFEFLEHIYDDISVISKIPFSSKICFSVPSFNATGHVRYFNSKEDVISRYSDYILIEDIKEILVHGGPNKIYLFQGTKK